MKIGICGTMSVGKSTLVKALQQDPYFNGYNFSTERSKYLRDLGIPLNTDSTIKGQIIFLAERSSELMNENIITDRTIIDVMAFTSLANSIHRTDKERFIDLAQNLLPEYDYIFYISPEGIPIEDNGVRTIDTKYRQEVDDMIKIYLKKYSDKIKNYYEIFGSTDERIRRIKEVIGFNQGIYRF